MPDAVVRLIIAAFPDTDGAGCALEAVRRARDSVPGEILDAAAVTRCPDGTLVMQGAAEVVAGGGFAVSAVMGAVLGLLGTAGTHPSACPSGSPPARLRAAALPEGQLRGMATLLTPARSALLTLVTPAGVPHLARAVKEAWKLAVEDLSPAAVRGLAGSAALRFAGREGAAVPRGTLATPHPGFAPFSTDAFGDTSDAVAAAEGRTAAVT